MSLRKIRETMRNFNRKTQINNISKNLLEEIIKIRKFICITITTAITYL